MIKTIQDAFYTYVILLIRPFKTHNLFRQQRIIRTQGEDVVTITQEGSFNIAPLSKEEAISFSWIMEIISAIYTILSINIGISTYKYITTGATFKSWVALKLYYSGQVSTIATTMMMVVLFPLTAWIYIKVWEMFVIFFMKLLEFDEADEEGAGEVVASTLSSNLFLLVPIFGSVIAKLSQILLLFAGLRSNLGMNIQQSILVLMAPLFMFVLFTLFMIGYMILMFTAL